MSVLKVENLTKSFGSDVIFETVSFSVEPGEAIGLVGANGAGKTTLFKILTGEYDGDSGSVIKPKGSSFGYMEQHICNDLEMTAYRTVSRIFDHVFQIENEIDALSAEINNGDDSQKNIEQLNFLTEKFQNLGGLTFKSRIRSTLIGLGISEAQFDQSVSSMSGGERSKLSLAALLLSDSNLMLLDEPTNHLDIKAIQWLEDFLIASQKAFIVISHDRYFLDKVTTKTFEIENSKLKVYNAPYTKHLELKKEQSEIEQKHYDDAKKQIEKMEKSIEKLRSFNREKSVKRAESKQKALEKFEKTLETPEKQESTIHFSFKCANPGPTEVLKAEGLSVRFGQMPLFENAHIDLRRGETVFLLGPNGSGKTTLMRQLINRFNECDLDGHSGRIRFGMGVKCAYYDQTLANLDLKKSVLDEVWDSRTDMTETQIRNALAAFLFKGNDVFKIISNLSGGERARVSLLKLMLSGANLLFLDEPTNHLDIGSREALEEALSDYNGTVFAVSHDRYFINKLADKLYYLDKEKTEEYVGSYDDYNAALERINATKIVEKKVSQGADEYKNKKRAEAELRRMKSALARCEKTIFELETEMEKVESELESDEIVSDYIKTMELTEELTSLQKKLSEKQEEWLELSITIENEE